MTLQDLGFTKELEEYRKEKIKALLKNNIFGKKEIDLFYFDESGFTLDPCVPYAWQPKGKATLELPSSRSQRLNLLGFMNRDSQGFFKTVTGSVTSDVVIDFFDEFAMAFQEHHRFEYLLFASNLGGLDVDKLGCHGHKLSIG